MTNKGALSSDDIILQESGVFINEDTKLADICNDYYVNIVKHTTGQPPSDITNDLDVGVSVDQIINQIFCKFYTHPSVKKIRESANNEIFIFRKITIEEIRKVIQSLDPKKAMASTQFRPKF